MTNYPWKSSLAANPPHLPLSAHRSVTPAPQLLVLAIANADFCWRFKQTEDTATSKGPPSRHDSGAWESWGATFLLSRSLEPTIYRRLRKPV